MTCVDECVKSAVINFHSVFCGWYSETYVLTRTGWTHKKRHGIRLPAQPVWAYPMSGYFFVTWYGIFVPQRCYAPSHTYISALSRTVGQGFCFLKSISNCSRRTNSDITSIQQQITTEFCVVQVGIALELPNNNDHRLVFSVTTHKHFLYWRRGTREFYSQWRLCAWAHKPQELVVPQLRRPYALSVTKVQLLLCMGHQSAGGLYKTRQAN
jgi:hypothetical protein